MTENLSEVTTNLNLYFCVAECKFLGEKGQAMEQQRLALSRLLICMNQPDFTIIGKEAEELFFQLTKVFQQNSQQVQALAIQAINSLTPFLKSAFFVTRSLTSVFEKSPALQPQALRLLGRTSNPASIQDAIKLIKLGLADPQNSRLCASAAIAAHFSKAPIEPQLDKMYGPAAAHCVMTSQSFDKTINVVLKSGNSYAQCALMTKLRDYQVDEKQKLKIYFQFLPDSPKSCVYEKLFVYLQVFKCIAELGFQSYKASLNIIFSAGQICYQQSRVDSHRLAFLRQVLRIYQTCCQSGVSQEQLKIVQQLLASASESQNTQISALAAINLIAQTHDLNTLGKLAQMLPQLQGELKITALELVESLAAQASEASPQLIQMLQNFTQSNDKDVRKSGFSALTRLAKSAAGASAARILKILLENFDECDDSNLNREICEMLGKVKVQDAVEARELAGALWMRCLLDGVQIRLAAVSALRNLKEQSQEVQEFVDKIFEDLYSKEENAMVREAIYANQSVVSIEKFSVDDLIAQSDLVLAGGYKKVTFGAAAQAKAKKQESSKPATAQSSQILQLNPNYKKFQETYSNQEFEAACSATNDVQVEVCKCFYASKKAKELMLIYRIRADEGLELSNIKLTISGNEINKFDKQGDHYQVLVTLPVDDFMEVFIEGITLSYQLESSDDDIELYDVQTCLQDFIHPIDFDYQEFFDQNAEAAQKGKFTLSEIPDLQECLESVPTFIGLYLKEITEQDEKHVCFVLTGEVFQHGQIVLDMYAKQLKAGVGIKVDCRGAAAEAVLALFEQ